MKMWSYLLLRGEYIISFIILRLILEPECHIPSSKHDLQDPGSNPGKGKKPSLLQNSQTASTNQAACHSVGKECLSPGVERLGLRTNHFDYPAPRLRE
jgi:hypothetical protein